MLARLLCIAAMAAALFAGPASAAVTRTAPVSRIVAGSTPSRAWPAQVFVEFTTTAGTFDCGGSLVSARWVLTAGHCATDSTNGTVAPASGYRMGLGGGDPPFVASRTFTADQVVRDPSFIESAPPTNVPSTDLALVHLVTPAQFDPIRLIGPDEGALWTPGTMATIIGYGLTATGGTPSGTLLEAKVPIVADSTCSADYTPAAGPNPFNAANMLCAGDGVHDTCQGDSGGPLMVPRQGDFVLAAVTSWGIGCAGPLPGVYARVGAPAINAWLRTLVPAVTIAGPPPSAVTGDTVAFSASALSPTAAQPAFSWDLNGDGVYGDATGPTASTVFATPGARTVSVRTTYPDGDGATDHQPVSVTGDPLPPPPPAPVIADTPPAFVPAPQPPTAIAAAAPTNQSVGLVTAPDRVTLNGLRTRGLSVRYNCAVACSVKGRLTVDAALARKLGIAKGKSSVTIGTASAKRSSPGKGTLTIHVTPTAKRALAKFRSGSVLVLSDLLAPNRRVHQEAAVAIKR